MIVEFWNLQKMLWSLTHFLTFGMVQPYAPVPTFASPAAAAAYLGERFVYTGDPLMGVIDFTVNPTRLQAAMEDGPEAVKRLALDCDDVAAWAFVALRQMGATPTIYTLKDSSGKFGHHVVTAYVWRGEQGVIDTNGHQVLRDVAPATLCYVFTDTYRRRGYQYTEAVVTACPF